jgi:hypothetical protein
MRTWLAAVRKRMRATAAVALIEASARASRVRMVDSPGVCTRGHVAVIQRWRRGVVEKREEKEEVWPKREEWSSIYDLRNFERFKWDPERTLLWI